MIRRFLWLLVAEVAFLNAINLLMLLARFLSARKHLGRTTTDAALEALRALQD